MTVIPEGFSREQLLQAIDREIHKRERFYPGWVARGRMLQSQADSELAAMRAVYAVIAQLEPSRPAQGALFDAVQQVASRENNAPTALAEK